MTRLTWILILTAALPGYAFAQPGGDQPTNPAAVSGPAESEPAQRPAISPEVYRAIRPAAMRQFDAAIRQANKLEKEIDRQDAHRLIYTYQQRYLQVDLEQGNYDQATLVALSINDNVEKALALLRVSQAQREAGQVTQADVVLRNVLRVTKLVEPGESKDEILSTVALELFRLEQFDAAYTSLDEVSDIRNKALLLGQFFDELHESGEKRMIKPDEAAESEAEVQHPVYQRLENYTKAFLDQLKTPRESIDVTLILLKGRSYPWLAILVQDEFLDNWSLLKDPALEMRFGLLMGFQRIEYSTDDIEIFRKRFMELAPQQAKGWKWTQHKKQLAVWLMRKGFMDDAEIILKQMDDPIERDGVLYDGITWLAKHKPEVNTNPLVPLFDSEDYRDETLRIRSKLTDLPDPKLSPATQPSED